MRPVLNILEKSHRIFPDSRVIFAVVFSETGGARKLFRLGKGGVLQLVVGPNILRECEAVVRRKGPASMPRLAYLLELGMVEVAKQPSKGLVEQAKAMVAYEPNAYVLAEAIGAVAEWFITHDKAHFLKANLDSSLAMHIGTPGDLIEVLEDEYTQS